ncbi:hypothetical protein BHY40_14880 [Listeria monocytogenes]|nr:hypothetical protein [Listeria monocytogenes]
MAINYLTEVNPPQNLPAAIIQLVSPLVAVVPLNHREDPVNHQVETQEANQTVVVINLVEILIQENQIKLKKMKTVEQTNTLDGNKK